VASTTYRTNFATFADGNPPSWPAWGSDGSPISGTMTAHEIYPHGLSGAFEDNSGDIVVFSAAGTMRSTNFGASFADIMKDDADNANNLKSVVGAGLNPTDNSIVLANYYNSNLYIWGTTDYGSTFEKLTSVSATNLYDARVVSNQNLVMVV